MGVERQVLSTGIDSWEGTMTYRGITYMVEAMERTKKGNPGWEIEMLRQTGRMTVQPLSCTWHPSLDTALEATEHAIRQLVDGDQHAQ